MPRVPKDFKCVKCLKRRRGKHFNAKYCLLCRKDLLKKPKSNLTKEQISEAKKLIGKMPRHEIAEHLGCSLANLKRAFRGVRLAYFNKYVRNPQLVKTVCKYYEKNGRVKTQKKFPLIKVRSIVERYKNFKPRQVRWTEKEIIQATRFSGLVSKKNQARYFNRPGANEGSITSFWMKKMKFSGASISGMSHCFGKYFVEKQCPVTTTQYWYSRRGGTSFCRKIYLWVDMENNLREDTPDFIKSAIVSMAKFQRWLFESENPRRKILKMINQVGQSKFGFYN